MASVLGPRLWEANVKVSFAVCSGGRTHHGEEDRPPCRPSKTKTVSTQPSIAFWEKANAAMISSTQNYTNPCLPTFPALPPCLPKHNTAPQGLSGAQVPNILLLYHLLGDCPHPQGGSRQERISGFVSKERDDSEVAHITFAHILLAWSQSWRAVREAGKYSLYLVAYDLPKQMVFWERGAITSFCHLFSWLGMAFAHLDHFPDLPSLPLCDWVKNKFSQFLAPCILTPLLYLSVYNLGCESWRSSQQ